MGTDLLQESFQDCILIRKNNQPTNQPTCEADGLGYSDVTAINLLAKSHKIFSYFSFPFPTYQFFPQVYSEIHHLWKDGYEGLFYYLQCLLLLIFILS